MYAERKSKTFEIIINLWEKNVETHAKEKVSRLHFYFHDTPSGKNQSAVEVAEASMVAVSLFWAGMQCFIQSVRCQL